MDKPRRLLIGATAAALFAPLAKAQKRELNIVYFQDFPPFSFGEGLSVSGIFVDVVNEALGKRNGVSLSHRGLPWARAQDMVKQGMADAFVSLVTTERRTFTDAGTMSIYSGEVHLYVAANHPRRAALEAVTDAAGFAPFSLATYIGNSLATSAFAHMSVSLASTAEQSVEMAINQRVDVVPGESTQMRRYLKNLGTPDALVQLKPVVARLAYFLQIRKTLPDQDLLKDCDKALRAMVSDGTLSAIIARHQA